MINKFLRPYLILDKILWLLEKKKFNSVGKGVSIGASFDFYGHKYINIGNNVLSRNGLKLHAWKEYKGKIISENPNLTIEDRVSFGDNCYVTCSNSIKIGQGTLIGDNVFITDNNHGKSDKFDITLPPAERDIYSKGSVEIGENVWIGRNVSIMPDVKIGDGVVIGANSVVTKNIPPYCIIAGSPAKIIRKIEL
ncbi:acyltransferase [Streptococcus sp. 29896]|uniref:Acyltransferase n=1 Tax=Streptococcus suivaginalis TaxID=3028082 RepID=A0AA96VEB2_9STRE|nr:acyltransferase [Streptococcus sp. 29896]WNY47696.1 acyltransferase [Streptococcus sp. 29896]